MQNKQKKINGNTNIAIFRVFCAIYTYFSICSFLVFLGGRTTTISLFHLQLRTISILRCAREAHKMNTSLPLTHSVGYVLCVCE